MRYIELAIKISPFKESITDVLSFNLGGIGYDSFVVTENVLKAYITEKSFSEEELKNTLHEVSIGLKELFCGINLYYEYTIIEDENWNKEWESNYFKPLVIADECVVRSSFHEVNEQYKYDIIIDPKMAFGTGHHQTTYLMLQEILKLDLNNKSVLDMGCGTAVLAILASQKGADPITAIDFDKWAYENAKENVELNNILNVKVLLGEVDLIANDTYDFIFANINRNVLLQDIKHYESSLNDGGMLIMSGFYLSDVSDIKKECKRYGLTYQKTEQRDKWCAVICSKN